MSPRPARGTEIGRRTIAQHFAAREATIEDWQTACATATLELQRGERARYDPHKHRSWDDAILSVAGELLAEQGLGRSKGPVPPSWVDVVMAFADAAAINADGCVPTTGGLRIRLSTLRARRR